MSNRIEIRLAVETKPLPIPYPANLHDGNDNHGYISLIDNPDAINNIPELEGEPHMKKFITKLNSTGGIFESVRMVHWFNSSENRTSQCLCFGFVFRDRELFSSYNNCFLFSGELIRIALDHNIAFDAPPLLEMQPAQFVQEDAGGWIMDIYVGASGADEDEARHRLGQLLTHLLPIFCPET
jgi:hypothetical protein